MDLVHDANLLLSGTSWGYGVPNRETFHRALDAYDQPRRAHGIVKAMASWEAQDPGWDETASIWGEVVSHYPWVIPLLPVPCDVPLPDHITQSLGSRFRGISLHPRDHAEWSALLSWPARQWNLLGKLEAVVRIHGRIPSGFPLLSLPKGSPDCRFVIADLGSAGPFDACIPPSAIQRIMLPLLEAAREPNASVILSGLYRTGLSPWAYPHPEAWPIMDSVLEAFGPERLIWGSGQPQSSEAVSFPQTLHAVEKWATARSLCINGIFSRNLSNILTPTHKHS